MSTPKACSDCVDAHGDTTEGWLAKWPEGAIWREFYRAYLCDGCLVKRDSYFTHIYKYDREESDDY